MTTIEERYIKLHPKSKILFEEAQGLFPDGVTHDARRMNPFPLYINYAKGCKKWDEDGHEYIDYIGGHGAHLLGHSHPEIVRAIGEQISKGTQYAFSTKLEVKWAKLVKDLIPSIEKLRFQSTGTEATLMALRMARAYTGKSKIIKFEFVIVAVKNDQVWICDHSGQKGSSLNLEHGCQK